MLDQTISNRAQQYNDLITRWNKFYNGPLVQALKILKKELKYNAADIAREVFNGNISEDGVNDFIQRNSKEAIQK